MITSLSYTKDNYNYELNVNIKNIDLCYLNFIRRSITNNIKGYSLGNFDFIKNKSSICNEIIEHRLSMIPINKISKEKIIINEENYSNEIKSVFTDDIKTDIELPSNIEICRLKKDERIYCIFDVIEGYGREHSKFKPIITSYFNKEKNNTYNLIIESHFDNIFKLLSELIKIFKNYNEILINKLENINLGKNLIKILNNELPIEYTNILCSKMNKCKFINYYRKFYSDDFYLLKIIIEDKNKFNKEFKKTTNNSLKQFKHLIGGLKRRYRKEYQ